MTAALTFAVTAPTLLTAHTIADHWIQTGHQAATKHRRDWSGARACGAHVATYTATTAAFVVLTWTLLNLHITPLGFALGQTTSAVTHYWADRRYTLRWLAQLTRRSAFYNLGTPRPHHDDNPTLGTGAYALDQSYHWAWLFTAALITATVN